VFLVQNLHGVVNGDHADQTVVGVDHGGGNQVILVKGVGHVGLVLIDGKGAKTVLGDVAQGAVAPRRQQPAKRHIANRFVFRIDQVHVVKLLGQVFGSS